LSLREYCGIFRERVRHEKRLQPFENEAMIRELGVNNSRVESFPKEVNHCARQYKGTVISFSVISKPKLAYAFARTF
jgi:hypothetical protein